MTSNLNGDGTATLDQGDIAVTGGSTVTVNSNLTITAKNETANNAHTFGDVTVTGDGKTTSVTVNQTYTETEFTKAAVAVVKEQHTVTFKALASNETTTIDGLTFTASKALTAAEVAAAFSNLTASDTQTNGGKVANGVFTGALSGNFTSGAANGAVVVFTAKDESEALSLTAGAIDPTETTVAGTAASAEVTSTNTVTYGAVRVDGAATDTITTVTINGYGSADLGNTGNDLNALTTLSLANSGGLATVATSAAALALTLNNVNDAVTLTAPALKTLNVTTAGKDSSFALTANAVETLTVAGDKKATFSADLVALTAVTVTGSAGLALSGNEADTLTSVNTSATTGAVSATIDGSKATYTGGAGVDVVTLSTTAALTKAIDLGAGDDTLVFGSAAVTGSTATLSGGAGTDTLSMTVARADALDVTTQTFYTNFERLLLNDAAGDTDGVAETVTIDLEKLGFVNHVTTTGTLLDTTTAANADTLVLDNLANNGTVVIAAAAAGVNTKHTVNIKDATTGTADVLNAEITSATTDVNFGTLTAAKVETINLKVSDSQLDNDADGVNDAVQSQTLVLTAADATAVNLTGNANLTLTLTGSNALTSLDGSALTGVLTVTADTTAALTVKGGSGNDVLTASGSSDVLIGGAGNDTLTGANLSTLTGGAGNDIFKMNVPTNVNSYSSITDLAAGDVIDLDAANAGTVVFTKSAVVLAGTAVFQDYANAAVNALTTDANDAAWFQFAGNTYIVQSGNVTAGNDFVNGQDSIIQIVGLVDLSTASYNQSIGTLEIA